MKKRDQAAKLFKEGYNCAQSVVMAFTEEIGFDDRTAAKLASSFGGGMGRLREVCGAVTAMFLIAGLTGGYDCPNNDQVKTEHYKHIQELAERFKQKNGSIICRELLGKKEGPDDFVPEKRTESYYASRPCEKFVADAAEIIEKYLKELR